MARNLWLVASGCVHKRSLNQVRHQMPKISCSDGKWLSTVSRLDYRLQFVGKYLVTWRGVYERSHCCLPKPS